MARGDFNRARFENCDLQGADLTDAHLSHAYLARARLDHAFLVGTNLSSCDLTEASLTAAELALTNLTGATLAGTRFHRSILRGVLFCGCRDLHRATGLDEVVHGGSCSLDAETLRATLAHLPDSFLRGVGYEEREIETLRAAFAPSHSDHSG
jgi:uncharacterized protein YjbI with pentapeptide repeats